MKWLPLLIIAVLLVLVWRLSETVIRLENYSHGGQVGMCYEAADYTKDIAARDRRERCLRQTQTRTNPLWHLAYALGLI